jgi:hypothetical protein
MAATINGLYCLGDNLLIRFTGNFRFMPSNQTWSPKANGLKRGQSLTQVSCALRCASWAAFLASVILLSRCSSVGMFVFLVGW